jgi:DNA-binding CsgD family transcriptional regulator
MIQLLTQILRVQAIQAASNKSVTEGARLLKLAGLDNQTIAEVLNTSAATVRTLTANLRTGIRTGRGRSRKGR